MLSQSEPADVGRVSSPFCGSASMACHSFATPIAGRDRRQWHSVDFVKFRKSVDGRKRRTALIAYVSQSFGRWFDLHRPFLLFVCLDEGSFTLTVAPGVLASRFDSLDRYRLLLVGTPVFELKIRGAETRGHCRQYFHCYSWRCLD